MITLSLPPIYDPKAIIFIVACAFVSALLSLVSYVFAAVALARLEIRYPSFLQLTITSSCASAIDYYHFCYILSAVHALLVLRPVKVRTRLVREGVCMSRALWRCMGALPGIALILVGFSFLNANRITTGAVCTVSGAAILLLIFLHYVLIDDSSGNPVKRSACYKLLPFALFSLALLIYGVITLSGIGPQIRIDYLCIIMSVGVGAHTFVFSRGLSGSNQLAAHSEVSPEVLRELEFDASKMRLHTLQLEPGPILALLSPVAGKWGAKIDGWPLEGPEVDSKNCALKRAGAEAGDRIYSLGELSLAKKLHGVVSEAIKVQSNALLSVARPLKAGENGAREDNIAWRWANFLQFLALFVVGCICFTVFASLVRLTLVRS